MPHNAAAPAGRSCKGTTKIHKAAPPPPQSAAPAGGGPAKRRSEAARRRSSARTAAVSSRETEVSRRETEVSRRETGVSSHETETKGHGKSFHVRPSTGPTGFPVAEGPPDHGGRGEHRPRKGNGRGGEEKCRGGKRDTARFRLISYLCPVGQKKFRIHST